MRENKKTCINGEVYYVHRLEDNFVKMNFLPRFNLIPNKTSVGYFLEIYVNSKSYIKKQKC